MDRESSHFIRIREFRRIPKQPHQKKLPPLLCVHGAPESHLIWLPYLRDFCLERDVYVLAFPSHDNSAPTPSCFDMMFGRLWNEFVNTLDCFARSREKFSIVAHDFGAAWCWSWVKQQQQNRTKVASFITISVGSEFRYDLFELGPLGALTWCYSLPLSLSYYFRWLSLADFLLRRFSQYRGKQKVSFKSLCE